jgi:hypothetical protein
MLGEVFGEKPGHAIISTSGSYAHEEGNPFPFKVRGRKRFSKRSKHREDK